MYSWTWILFFALFLWHFFGAFPYLHCFTNCSIMKKSYIWIFFPKTVSWDRKQNPGKRTWIYKSGLKTQITETFNFSIYDLCLKLKCPPLSLLSQKLKNRDMQRNNTTQKLSSPTTLYKNISQRQQWKNLQENAFMTYK